MSERFLAGETFPAFLDRPKKNGDLWNAVYRRARVSDEAEAKAGSIRRPWHLLVLSEDWCSDSTNTLPVVARLTETVPLIDMRIISRDANPELMDYHLTGLSRSIPVIMVLDEDFNEHGWWGPRPGPLQSWVVERGLALPKEERYREVRTWYVRDQGETALNELLEIITTAEQTL